MSEKMSREEAINILKVLASFQGGMDYLEQHSVSVQDACNMAIRALENHDTFMKYSYSLGKHDALSQEPCDECRNKRSSFCGNCKEYDEFEPCDDAISREDAINIASLHTLTIDESVKALERLPSVTQKSCEKCNYKIFTDLYFHTDPEMVEQEPCTDAVSREAVDEIKELMTDINGDAVYAVRMSDIRQLPSVTQKSGKWIDINGIYAECSSCNEEIYITGDFKYCPNCGAKMESEDK